MVILRTASSSIKGKSYRALATKPPEFTLVNKTFRHDQKYICEAFRLSRNAAAYCEIFLKVAFEFGSLQMPIIRRHGTQLANGCSRKIILACGIIIARKPDMAIVIDNPALEEKLASSAKKAGASLPDYTEELLLNAEGINRNIVTQSGEEMSGTLYDRIKDHIGLFSSGNTDTSQNIKQIVSEIIEEKHKNGKL